MVTKRIRKRKLIIIKNEKIIILIKIIKQKRRLINIHKNVNKINENNENNETNDKVNVKTNLSFNSRNSTRSDMKCKSSNKSCLLSSSISPTPSLSKLFFRKCSLNLSSFFTTKFNKLNKKSIKSENNLALSPVEETLRSVLADFSLNDNLDSDDKNEFKSNLPPNYSNIGQFNRSISVPPVYMYRSEESNSVIENLILNNISNYNRRDRFNDIKIEKKIKCELAHGSEMIELLGIFETLKELYEKICLAFKIEMNEILFCTLNTNQVDMERLIEISKINFEDLIYVHLKGEVKEIELVKTKNLLGLTITDNYNGLCFIKKIKENSFLEKVKFINVGDHIERINNTSLVGWHHFEVTNFLKEIPVGELFVMCLIEPIRSLKGKEE